MLLEEITAFVRDTIEEKLAAGQGNGPVSAKPRQGTEEWFAVFNQWVGSHPPRQFLADDTRAAIYSDESD